jgi:hypothetical protein
VSVLDGNPPQFVLRDGSVIQGVQRPIDLTQEGPAGGDDQEPVVPEPVKSEVVDLTQDEDPGGIIASAVGGDDQEPVVNEPASMDQTNPEQPHNILRQLPQGGDDDTDGEDLQHRAATFDRAHC